MSLKSHFKKSIVDLARLRGYELIPAWSLDKQPLVRHLKALLEKYRIDCVLDVGGNMGQYHDLIRDDVGFVGTIVSFEPVSKYVSILRDKARADPAWKICDYALGCKDEIATINVTKSPGLNSFLAPRTDVLPNFWNDDSISGTESVRVRMLDSVFEELRRELRFQAPYLKLDTQGFDLEALRGSAQALTQVRALQTEASVRPLYAGMPDHLEVLKYTESIGFELSGMFSVSHDDAMRLIEFDCVMVNKHFAAMG